MKIEDLRLGKVYLYKDTECLRLDQLPIWHNNNIYVFVDPEQPQLNIQYLEAEDVNNFITELKIEKQEVANFRPDHYTSLPLNQMKYKRLQRRIALELLGILKKLCGLHLQLNIQVVQDLKTEWIQSLKKLKTICIKHVQGNG